MLAGFVGFLAGQILGSVFELIGATLTHYPGGLSALGNNPSPPWWANAFGLLGLWIGFGGAIYYAYNYGNLRALPNQWRPRPSDVMLRRARRRLSVPGRRRVLALQRAIT